MDEDDLYGADLYGDDDTALDFEVDEPYDDALGLPKSDDEGKGNNSRTPAEKPDPAQEKKEVREVRSSEDEEKIKELQERLKESQAQVDKWRGAFRDVAKACGLGIPSNRDPEVGQVVQIVTDIQASVKQLKDENRNMRHQEAALHVQLAEKNLENIELRRSLNNSWQATEPSILQVKQLLLDPAINREFQRLKSEVEDSHKEVRRVQEELEVVTFTQESKAGRQLMAKCRALQEENEEMGRELSDSRAQQLQTQLDVAKELTVQMKKCLVDIQDHSRLVDEENEELQTQMFMLKRKIRDLEGQLHFQHHRFDRKPDFARGGGHMGRGMGRAMGRAMGMAGRGPPMDRDMDRKRHAPEDPFLERKRMR